MKVITLTKTQKIGIQLFEEMISQAQSKVEEIVNQGKLFLQDCFM